MQYPVSLKYFNTLSPGITLTHTVTLHDTISNEKQSTAWHTDNSSPLISYRNVVKMKIGYACLIKNLESDKSLLYFYSRVCVCTCTPCVYVGTYKQK